MWVWDLRFCMDKLLKKYWPLFVLILLPYSFLSDIFGYISFPGEIIQKQFYPWRDQQHRDSFLPWETKNYWGSDPFIAHYPWKFIGFELIKKGVWLFVINYCLFQRVMTKVGTLLLTEKRLRYIRQI